METMQDKFMTTVSCSEERMEFNSKLFFSALGLAFILEALPYTLFPERMRQVLQTLGEEGASGLRRMGLFSLAAGLIVLWLTLG